MARRGWKANPAYDAEHRATRAKLLPLAYGRLCPLNCGELMLKGQKLDLDHVTPLMFGQPDDGRRQIAHAHCNRRQGALLQAKFLRSKRRRRVLRPAPWTTSRSW